MSVIPTNEVTLNVTEIKHKVYDCSELNIPIITRKLDGKLSNIEVINHDDIKLAKYTVIGPTTNEYFVYSFDQLFKFKLGDDIFVVGIMESLMKSQNHLLFVGESVNRENNYITKEIAIDVLIEKKNKLGYIQNDYTTSFHHKDENYIAVTSEPEFINIINSINFNHVCSAIMDYFKLENSKGNVTDFNPEEVGIFRTKTVDKLSIIFDQVKIESLNDVVSKALDKNYILPYALFDDTEKTIILERNYQLYVDFMASL